MKAAIVYESINYGNTEKVAKAIAQELNAKLIPYKEAKEMELADYDIIGLGSGIAMGRPYGGINGLVNRLPKAEGKKVFLFYTAGDIDEKYMTGWKDALAKKGYAVAGEFGCKGEVSSFKILFWTFKIDKPTNLGKPDAEDLKQAREFAARLIKR